LIYDRSTVDPDGNRDIIKSILDSSTWYWFGAEVEVGIDTLISNALAIGSNPPLATTFILNVGLFTIDWIVLTTSSGLAGIEDKINGFDIESNYNTLIMMYGSFLIACLSYSFE